MLYFDITHLENSVDPYQLASYKLADQEIHSNNWNPVCSTNNSSQPKYMLWVLKRTIEHPKHTCILFG